MKSVFTNDVAKSFLDDMGYPLAVFKLLFLGNVIGGEKVSKERVFLLVTNRLCYL